MIVKEKVAQLKNGLEVSLRSPKEDEASAMLEYLLTCSKESDFLLHTPEEIQSNINIDQEIKWIKSKNESADSVLIVAFIDQQIVGSLQLDFHNKSKTKHRADLSIAIIQQYWGLGLGTKLIQECIEIAKNKECQQIELEMIEGNTPAYSLYTKMGFETYGIRPNSIHLKNGQHCSETLMYLDLTQKK